MRLERPDARGRFGDYGGRFAPETLMPALAELEEAFEAARADDGFASELNALLRDYVGRPTPLYEAERLSEELGVRVLLKREDLLHTGAHKINNTIGQGLLAPADGQAPADRRDRGRPARGGDCHGGGAVRHGVRRLHGRGRHRTPGAQRRSHGDARRRGDPGHLGSRHAQGCRERSDAGLGGDGGRDPLHHRVGGGARIPSRGSCGSSSGSSARRRSPNSVESNPTWWPPASAAARMRWACSTRSPGPDRTWSGSRPAGTAWTRVSTALRWWPARPACSTVRCTYLLQDDEGQVREAHSVSAGLDYPGVGPEHSYFRDPGIARYVSVTDDEALDGLDLLARTEGIIPALEPAHVIAWLSRERAELAGKTVVVCLSGRGDKDVEQVAAMREGSMTFSAHVRADWLPRTGRRSSRT